MSNIIRLWVLSLAVAAVCAATVTAQYVMPRGEQMTRTQPRVISGDDVGFRVEGIGPKGEPVGHFVIRVNGEWVEAGGLWSGRPAAN